MPQPAPVVPPITERDHKHLAPFQEALLQVLKYVDDNIIHELLNFDKINTDGTGTRSYHATRSQNLFHEIVARALYCGMKVNGSKTNAILISELKSYLPEAFLYDNDGNKIIPSDKIKILGFHFSDRPDMQAQVDDVKRKFKTRMWALRHLGHVGFSAEDLLKVYQSTILPCHDYCSVVFHSSLTKTQSDSLERLQAQALKCIYGYQYSYRALLEISGLKTLYDRREDRCNKFALKCLSNERMSHFFPSNPNVRPLRHVRPYLEFPAKTSRLMNSLIFDLRRRLNAMSVPN